MGGAASHTMIRDSARPSDCEKLVGRSPSSHWRVTLLILQVGVRASRSVLARARLSWARGEHAWPRAGPTCCWCRSHRFVAAIEHVLLNDTGQ